MPDFRSTRPPLFRSDEDREATADVLETLGIGRDQIANATADDYAEHDWRKVANVELTGSLDEHHAMPSTRVIVTYCQDCGIAVLGESVPRKGMVFGRFVLPENPPPCSNDWDEASLRFDW